MNVLLNAEANGPTAAVVAVTAIGAAHAPVMPAVRNHATPADRNRAINALAARGRIGQAVHAQVATVGNMTSAASVRPRRPPLPLRCASFRTPRLSTV